MDETDEAFANVYSGAVSTQNLLSRVPQRVLIAGASVIATAGALAIDMRSYQRFLLLLGAVFVPLLGVLVGALAAATERTTRERDIFGSPSFRVGADRRLGRRLSALRVALPAAGPRLLERPDREAPDARSTRSEPRSRASRSRSS